MAEGTAEKKFHVLIQRQEIDDVQLALVSRIRILAEQGRVKVCCILIGKKDERAADELAHYGADTILFVDNPVLANYRADSSPFYVEALSQLLAGVRRGNIFCTDSLADRDLACRLASRLGAGLISGCVDLYRNESGSMLYDKPAYLSNIIDTVSCPGTALNIVTVKADAWEKVPAEIKKTPEIRTIQPRLESAGPVLETLDIVQADPSEIGLDEAMVIVTGGRGMGSAENFKLLYQLAELLGGTVAGSLGAVDEGWISRNRLVGQTGATVKPKLYIACGISGSIYHLMGMRDSKTIVAINKDRFAPIFKYADLGLVGDVLTLLPAIMASASNGELLMQGNRMNDA